MKRPARAQYSFATLQFDRPGSPGRFLLLTPACSSRPSSRSLNGVSYGLLLFMLSSGLTLIFSMMGVLNFAHASFYMLGAYAAYQLSTWLGFWPALVLAPLLVGRHRRGWSSAAGCGACTASATCPELLFTFGLSYIIFELVQLIWGRAAVPYRVPADLDGPLLHASSAPPSRPTAAS